MIVLLLYRINLTLNLYVSVVLILQKLKLSFQICFAQIPLAFYFAKTDT